MSQENNVDQLSSMTPEELDSLPFGVIELSADAKILKYNETEAAISGRDPKRVIGRNFFTEVAPCTAVKEFYGRFLDLIEHRAINFQFDFVFNFDPPTKVQITMLYEQREQVVWILVDKK